MVLCEAPYTKQSFNSSKTSTCTDSRNYKAIQGRGEGTSSAIIINCHTEFINLFIFNRLTSNINMLIFNFLTSNFCFSENISFASRRERLFMDARPQFRILSSPWKMMTYLNTDIQTQIKFLRYRSLFTSILKCGFPTKSIKLTRFVLFKVLGGPQV